MPNRDTILKINLYLIICEIESLRLKGIVLRLYATAMTSYMKKKEENFASISFSYSSTRQRGLHSHVSVNLYVLSFKVLYYRIAFKNDRHLVC